MTETPPPLFDSSGIPYGPQQWSKQETALQATIADWARHPDRSTYRLLGGPFEGTVLTVDVDNSCPLFNVDPEFGGGTHCYVFAPDLVSEGQAVLAWTQREDHFKPADGLVGPKVTPDVVDFPPPMQRVFPRRRAMKPRRKK